MEYILTANNLKRLVYCRFGDKYLEDLSKKRQSSTNNNMPQVSLSAPSSLLNIKKLIEEQNPEGERRDFKTMKNKNNNKLNDFPPAPFYRLSGP